MALPLALSVAGAAAAGSYLNARFSLEHDALFFKIAGGSVINIIRAIRTDKINFFYFLEKYATDPAWANRPFVLFQDRAHTYAETYQTVLKYGHWLKTVHGIQRKDIVALNCQNSDTFIFAWFGLWSIGATPAFINHHLTTKPLVHSLRTSTASLALVDPAVAESITHEVRDEVPELEFVFLTPELRAEIVDKTEPVRYADRERSEPSYVGMAILIYTSGTTGMPKPAIVSWAKIYTAVHLCGKGCELTKDDVFYTVSDGHGGEMVGGEK